MLLVSEKTENQFFHLKMFIKIEKMKLKSDEENNFF